MAKDVMIDLARMRREFPLLKDAPAVQIRSYCERNMTEGEHYEIEDRVTKTDRVASHILFHSRKAKAWLRRFFKLHDLENGFIAMQTKLKKNQIVEVYDAPESPARIFLGRGKILEILNRREAGVQDFSPHHHLYRCKVVFTSGEKKGTEGLYIIQDLESLGLA